MNNKKRSGVLLPLFSLPGKYGIGSLGQYCKKFIDFLSESKFSYWEVLPINMTNIEGSPYNLVDAFGTNYLYIDMRLNYSHQLLNILRYCADYLLSLSYAYIHLHIFVYLLYSNQ